MKRALKVFYGIGKINKIQKKTEIAVIFENGNNNPDRNLRMLSRWIKVVYVRNQTAEEMEDAEFKDRMFTNSKKIKSSIDPQKWRAINLEDIE